MHQVTKLNQVALAKWHAI